MKIAAIPAFNEELAIGSVVLRTRRHVDKVIVIDDGSTDLTAEVAQLAGAEVVSHGKNLGKGAAIKTAFEKAKEYGADCLVLLDGDGQHSPEEIPEILKPLSEGDGDVVIGSRFMDRKSRVPKYRRVGQEVLTAATNLASGRRLTDTQSGFRAFNRRAIETLKFTETGIGIESEMQLSAGETDLGFLEVPISCSYEGETSTYGPLYHGLEVLASIVRYISQRRPLTFFGIPGVISIFIGLYLGYIVLYKFNLNRILPTGTALLTAIFILGGTFSLFTGIILYNIGNQIAKLEK
jgi:glycosyltransferase involved in cell wall biosynthesis